MSTTAALDCALLAVIAGDRYQLTRLPSEGLVCVRWAVRKEGSRREPYIVELLPNGAQCTCNGYKYRSKCRHASALRELGLL